MKEPQPKTAPLPPWKFELDYWSAGHQLLRYLHTVRYPSSTHVPESPDADDAIRTFARIVRKADQAFALTKMQREWRIPDSGLVLIVYAAASSFYSPAVNGTVEEALVLAFGLNPPELLRARNNILRRRGFNMLLHVQNNRLWMSSLMEEVLCGSPITAFEFRRCVRQVKSLPEAKEKEK